jgi:hypothetical protein
MSYSSNFSIINDSDSSSNICNKCKSSYETCSCNATGPEINFSECTHCGSVYYETCSCNTTNYSCSKCGSTQSCSCNTNTSSSCITDTSNSCNTNTSSYCTTNTSSSSSSCCISKSEGCSCVSCLGSITSACHSESECHTSCDEIDLLSDNSDVFIYKHGRIITNSDRGITHDTPLILGSNKLDIDGLEQCENPLLVVKGDVYVSGHIYSDNNQSHEHIYAKKNKIIKADKAVFGTLDVAITTHDKYVKGLEPNITADGQLHNATFHHVDPKHAPGILYVNSINGPVVIILGSKDGCVNFRPNQTIVIKDISLNYNEGSSYNIYITVPKACHKEDQLYIQHYNSDCKLKVSANGVYILNTSGGSVTFRYYNSCLLDGHNAFNIENQFIGNQRVIPGTGIVFNMANEKQAQNLLYKK